MSKQGYLMSRFQGYFSLVRGTLGGIVDVDDTVGVPVEEEFVSYVHSRKNYSVKGASGAILRIKCEGLHRKIINS